MKQNEDVTTKKIAAGQDGPYKNTIEIRKKELSTITMEVAEIFEEAHAGILHQMYKALEQKFGIVLDAYKAIYRSETGRQKRAW